MERETSITSHRYAADVPLKQSSPLKFGYAAGAISDAWGHGEGISGWNYEFSQVSCGNFSGQTAELWLGDLQLFRDNIDQAVQYRGAPWPDSQLFISYLPYSSVIRYGSRRYQPGTIMTNRWDAVSQSSSSGPFESVGVVVRRKSLELAAARRIDDPLKRFEDGVVAMTSSGVRRFQLAILRALSSWPKIVTSERVTEAAAILNDKMLSLVLDCVSGDDRWNDLPPASTRDYIVDQARAYIEAELARPISIGHLCRLLKVSERTLEYGFREALGTTPHRYIVMQRLEGVRRLIKSEGANRQIKDIAFSLGFQHLVD